MEPPKSKMILTWDSTVCLSDPNSFVLDAPYGTWICQDHQLKLGDRVKITITKEPADAQKQN